MTFELAQIVAQLVQAIRSFGETEGSEDGLVDVLGGPAADVSTAMQENLEEANDSPVVDFDAGIDSNYEVAVSSCGEQIDDILDGLVGAVIGGFESAVWAMLRVRSVVEAAVGKGSAQPFVEEQK